MQFPGEALYDRTTDPRYPAFLITGLIILLAGFFVLLAGRDALIAIWVNKLFDGDTQATGLLRVPRVCAGSFSFACPTVITVTIPSCSSNSLASPG